MKRAIIIAALIIFGIGRDKVEYKVIDAEASNNMDELVIEAESLGYIERVHEIVKGKHLLVYKDGNFKYTYEKEDVEDCDIYKVRDDRLFNYADYDVLINGMYYVGQDIKAGKYAISEYVFSNAEQAYCAVYEKGKVVYHKIGDIVKLKKSMAIQLVNCGIRK